MTFERRLACALVLMLSATPIVLGFLPENPGGLVAPFAILAATIMTLLSVHDRMVAAACAATGSLSLVVFIAHLGLAQTTMVAAVVPGTMLIVGAPVWTAAAAAAVATLATAFLLPSPAFAPFSLASIADIIGWLAILGWTAILGLALSNTRAVKKRVEHFEDTAAVHDQGIARDTMELRALTRILADPSLAPVVRGQGLTHDHLNMATRLFDGRILLAILQGDLTSTLTAGWILRTSVLGGEDDPVALTRMLEILADEVLDPHDIQWIAIFDPETGDVRSTPSPEGVRFEEARVRFHDRVGKGVSRETLELRMEVQSLPLGDTQSDATGIFVGMVICLSILFTLTAVVGTAWSVLLLAALCGFSFAIDRHIRALRSVLASAEAAIEDRIDCRDDLHFAVARLHGTLLPYELELDTVSATAHRLRGEVLAGTFADMLKTPNQELRIIAGEVSGEGVAAAFLSLSAQFALRAILTNPSKTQDWQTAENVASGIVAREATSLFFPVRIELGCVVIDDEGRFQGKGFLERVTTFDIQDRISSNERAGTLTPNTFLYITPATSRPGPEDTAPQLDRFEASERISDIIEAEEWKPGSDRLGSLFSLVFDGFDAPAHGTIIEISPREASPMFLEDGGDTLFTVVEAPEDQDDDAA